MGRTNFNKKVQLREAIIVRTLNQQKNAAVTEAVRKERERIYQDVHDGIGSQLVKAIYCLNRHGQALDAVVHNLQACLDDLRLVINAYHDECTDIQSAVFAFCLAQESHLEGAGLAISYDIGSEATLFSESAVCLNILRALQESIANTIKHSRASEISIQLREEGNELILLIRDNGGPLAPDIRNVQKNLYGVSGRVGLDALARRAETIGARHNVTITETGTEIRFSVPLPVIPPISTDLRSRTVMQPWPDAALG
jgi:signal transduction histidine kinase